MTKRLTRMDVGHVQFHDRASQNRQRVANAVAVMGPGTRVDQHRIHPIGVALVDALAHSAFMVGLVGLHRHPEFSTEGRQAGIYFVERDGSVLRRVALAKHIVVDTVQHEYVHRGSWSGNTQV